jgi:GNAT superfamily N-acetyltransferase
MTPNNMTPDNSLEAEFLAYAIEQTHPFARACAADGLSSNVLGVLRLHLDWITNAAFAQSHSEGHECFGLPVAAFNNRLIDIGALRVIAGIRFRNLDSGHPFVSIEHASLPIGTLASTAQLMDTMKAEFAAFGPRSLSFDHPSHLPLRVQGAAGDLHVLIAPAQAMATMLAAPPGLERVTLVPAADIGFYERYVALYDDIYQERPWARNEVRVEDRETLEDCREQGLLFHVRIDEVWSGIVAAVRWGAAAGGAVRGIQVAEIVLAKSARGRGLGIAVQRRLAEHIAASEPNTTIWGTVAHVNLPMRRTAERAGRTDIGATYWVDF